MEQLIQIMELNQAFSFFFCFPLDASVCEVSRAQHQQQSSGLSLSQVVQKDDDQHTGIT